jgi:hypothetical protein
MGKCHTKTHGKRESEGMKDEAAIVHCIGPTQVKKFCQMST